MFVKNIMTKTSMKFYESDLIQDISRTVVNNQLKGGLIYNFKDEIIGCFTRSLLLEGIIDGKEYVSEISARISGYVNEIDKIQNISFLSEYITPVHDNEENVTGFLTKEQYLLALADVKQKELSRLDAIFNSTHNGILSIDENGLITSINPQAEKMAKTKKNQAVGKFLTDIVVPSGLLEVVRTGEGHTEKYQVGNRMYLTHRSPIYDGNNIVGAVGVFQDISEIEFISSELESYKQVVRELDTILNNSNDGVCITDSKGTILKSNQSFKQLINGNQTDEKLAKILRNIVKEVVRIGRQHNVIEGGKFNGNSLIISAVPVRGSSKNIERIVISIKDMTEIDALRYELEQTRGILEHINNAESTDNYVANSPRMIKLMETVTQVAKVDVTVLLTGESGVGKEVVAKLIQENSPRAIKPFIKVNCGAIPESLIESELFGYEGGAFTGATKKGKIGLFEQANTGTIFLDEIGEIPLQLQVKLLRVLQEMEITRVGATKSNKIDIRVIAATNCNLKELVSEGRFREDLYYRLNVVPISIPPLRDRVEDIPLLISTYVKKFSEKYCKRIKFTKSAMDLLISYSWPGNVRELVNIVERIFVTSTNLYIEEEDLAHILGEKQEGQIEHQKNIVVNKVIPWKLAVVELEKEMISKAAEIEKSYRGIARLLEVNPSTIVRKVKKIEEGLY